MPRRLSSAAIAFRVIIWAALLVPGRAGDLNAQHVKTELQQEIGKILRFEQPVNWQITPGVWVGVYDGDSIYVLMYGDAMQEDAVFELGSVTKPVVAWLAQKALDSFGLEESTPLCSFLPDSLCSTDLSRISIDHILRHRAGLARLPASIGMHEDDVRDPYAGYQEHQLISDLQQIGTVPGMYRYSHTGYAMLRWVFDRAGGLTAFMEGKMTTPLGLHQTGFVPDSMLTSGHGMEGRLVSPWHPDAMSPALGLRSCVNDCIRFLRHVSDELVKRLPEMTPAIRRKLNSYSRSGMYHVEMGWFVIPSGKQLIYYHNGRTGGHHVSVAFSPHRDQGVVVFSNGAMGSGDLSLSVLHMLLKNR